MCVDVSVVFWKNVGLSSNRLEGDTSFTLSLYGKSVSYREGGVGKEANTNTYKSLSAHKPLVSHVKSDLSAQIRYFIYSSSYFRHIQSV